MKSSVCWKGCGSRMEGFNKEMRERGKLRGVFYIGSNTQESPAQILQI